jgi:hypothetical protein
MGLEESKHSIREAFMSYVSEVIDLLTRPASKRKTQEKITYLSHENRLRSLIENLENSAKFRKLSSAVNQALGEQVAIPFFIDWALSNFFKRSHLYADIYHRNKLDPEPLFRSLWSLLPTRSVTKKRLRLLGRLRFESKKLDCEFFKIQRFTKRELDRLIDAKTEDIFYPKTQLDTALLSRFWFIVEENTSENDFNLQIRDVGPSVPIEKPVQDRVLQVLALHKSTLGWTGPIWTGLTLPFSFEVNDDLFEAPLYSGELPNHLIQMRPIDARKLDREQELTLKNIAEKYRRVIGTAAAVGKWNFIEVAMGLLEKAFVTPPGLDQILWHVAVLDALLSEENLGIRQAMRPRIGNILGSTEAEKRGVRKRFDELYSFRSELVHGKTITEKAQHRHLGDARELARRTLLWFVDYMLWVDQHLQNQKVPYERYPTRSELLTLLDFDKPGLDRLSSVIRTLPKGFPSLGN